MKKNVKVLALGLALPLAVIMAGCGAPDAVQPGGGGGNATDAASVYEQLNALPAKEQRAKAIELAKKEGGLSLYTESPEANWQEYTAAFTADTGIAVRTFRASTVDLNQRVLQELSAKRVGADVILENFGGMIGISGEGAFTKYEGAGVDQLGDHPYYDGGWSAIAGYTVVPVWNTDLIPAGEEPKSWEDLADPRFDGKITIAADDGDLFGVVTDLWVKQGKSQAEIDDLWKKIADGAHAAKGHTAMAQMLGAGQTAVNAWNYDFIAESAIATGAPVAYRSADGIVHTETVAYPLGLAMFTDAQHPASAWLFYNWMLDEGQPILEKQHNLTAAQVSGKEKKKGMTIHPFPVEIGNNANEWNDKLDALLRGVPVQEKQ
ncbi:extracellular solute-binding protein [Microbacterium sp. SYP-A9085]|uniref:ABC transporter substrate-binding protein n=1 Tax=Microbacterium sp. SYP-A9085 TaxID=2664454 RepID=UPI00129BA5F2|nr:extracellular solute-binding protein [Microbacterium sp. SYP-A9085]MRH28016.1 extracellular solute-binding protein [Microbacterium sp. SYP-A9085]